MARRSIWILVSLLIAAAVAALFIGLSLYRSSPASYGHVLAQYLKAQASGDKETAQTLTSDGFVNELADLKLTTGGYRTYDFGFQEPIASESATMRFAVIVLGGEEEAAYLADAVFKKQGFKYILTAIRRIATGKPLAD